MPRYEMDAAALDAIDILAANLSSGAANSAAVEEAAMYAIRHWQAATGLADLGMANETLAFAGTASTGNAALLVMAGDGIDHALTILPPGTVSHDLAVNLADAAAAMRAGLPGARAERWRRIDVHELLANVYADVANVMQTDVLVSGRDVGDHGGDLSKIMTPTKRGFAPPLRKEAPASHAPKKKAPTAAPAEKEEVKTTPESMEAAPDVKEITEKAKARAEVKAEYDRVNADREAHKAAAKTEEAAKAKHHKGGKEEKVQGPKQHKAVKEETITLETCAYAGTGNVLKVQRLLGIAGEHNN